MSRIENDGELDDLDLDGKIDHFPLDSVASADERCGDELLDVEYYRSSGTTSRQRSSSSARLSVIERKRKLEDDEYHLRDHVHQSHDESDHEIHITDEQVNQLYYSLGVYNETLDDYRLNSIYVRSLDSFNQYEIERMFAEHNPRSLHIIDSTTCYMLWNSRITVAETLFDMTKPLRRFRNERQVEEGEVKDDGNGNDEEEDGELKEEYDDDVTINVNSNDGNQSPVIYSRNFVEINVDLADLPHGKWRVITKHVNRNRLFLVRLCRWSEISEHEEQDEKHPEDEESADTKMAKRRVRPGLNIFNENGEELDWDYEHDTRFFATGQVDTSGDEVEEKGKKEQTKIESMLHKRNIKTRGRGAKKFKFSDDEEWGTIGDPNVP